MNHKHDAGWLLPELRKEATGTSSPGAEASRSHVLRNASHHQLPPLSTAAAATNRAELI